MSLEDQVGWWRRRWRLHPLLCLLGRELRLRQRQRWQVWKPSSEHDRARCLVVWRLHQDRGWCFRVLVLRLRLRSCLCLRLLRNSGCFQGVP